jgi:hypothetical protein
VQVSRLKGEVAEAHRAHDAAVGRSEQLLAAERAKAAAAIDVRAAELDAAVQRQRGELAAAARKAEALERSVTDAEAAARQQACFALLIRCSPPHASALQVAPSSACCL